MKEIPLTQGQVAIIDDEDYERVSQYKWYAMWSPKMNSFYAARNSPRVNSRKVTILMHRFIMGAEGKEDVDHEDHDTLNNQKCNLRRCTHARNRANSPRYSTNRSGYKGVSWSERNKKWQVHLCVDGHRFFLGLFISKIEAAMAWDNKARELLGQFAAFNFPREGENGCQR